MYMDSYMSNYTTTHIFQYYNSLVHVCLKSSLPTKPGQVLHTKLEDWHGDMAVAPLGLQA